MCAISVLLTLSCLNTKEYRSFLYMKQNFIKFRFSGMKRFVTYKGAIDYKTQDRRFKYSCSTVILFNDIRLMVLDFWLSYDKFITIFVLYVLLESIDQMLLKFARGALRS